MEYPLIDRQILSQLRLVHAGYNLLVVLFFFYQARLGLKIRRARRADGPLPFPIIRRHRKGGPVIAVLGVIGFFIGLTLVLFDTGNILEYPSHFLIGCMIVLLIVTSLASSRQIKGQDTAYRTPHFVAGTVLLGLYVVEVFLGIGVLF